MTRKEQLKQAFTKEIKKLVGDHDIAMVDGVIIPINEVVNNTVNILLKEVSIRTKI